MRHPYHLKPVMPKLTAQMLFPCDECDPSLSAPPPCIHVMADALTVESIRVPCDCPQEKPPVKGAFLFNTWVA